MLIIGKKLEVLNQYNKGEITPCISTITSFFLENAFFTIRGNASKICARTMAGSPISFTWFFFTYSEKCEWRNFCGSGYIIRTNRMLPLAKPYYYAGGEEPIHWCLGWFCKVKCPKMCGKWPEMCGKTSMGHLWHQHQIQDHTTLWWSMLLSINTPWWAVISP